MGAPLETGLDPHETAIAYPYMSAYSALVRCKNLGLTLDATQYDLDLIECLHIIQETVEETASKKGKRNGK